MIVVTRITDTIYPGEAVVNGMIDAVRPIKRQVRDWNAEKIKKDRIVRPTAESRGDVGRFT